MRRRQPADRDTASTASTGRLESRPAQPSIAAPKGLHGLGLDNRRDGLLYVPPSYQPDRPMPFVLLLHGAGGNAQHGIALLRTLADSAGLILLAPDSRRETWDVIFGGYGSDIAFIDQALAYVFERYTVDPAHLVIGGFSDGASYALSVGLTNGDVFTHVIAFSPGFMVPASQQGMPRLFISHGTHDTVLPIQMCSRRIVPQVERAGYPVEYREFDGPHTVPPEIAQAAVTWLMEPES